MNSDDFKDIKSNVNAGRAFDLAAALESSARKVLAAEFGDGQKLAEELAISQSRNKGTVLHRIGDLSDIGNIGKTQAFADFRTSILRSFPAVRDVGFTTTSAALSFSLPSAWAIFYLKEPTLLRRITVYACL